MNLFDRNLVFKYLHEILMNKYKLFVIGRRNSPLCELCNVSETNIHMFLYCSRVKDCLSLLYRLIFYMCDLNINDSFLRFIFFNFPKAERKIQNTLYILISSYIFSIWYKREKNDGLTHVLKAKIAKEQKFHMITLENKAKDVFTKNYCELDGNILTNI